MRGWEPEGSPSRKLLNQNADIPAEAARVHGYTREILERDGELPCEVYRDFSAYAGDLPLVAFNNEYDLDRVLTPEWARLRIPAIGSRGFCALRLAQRLLDPVPAGNCKLQTLRQYYRLPERGAHTSLGDVQTVADLLAQVLRPVKESADYELCQLSDRKPGLLDELAAERATLLAQESVELEKRAAQLAAEIAELCGEAPVRIA